MKSSPYSFLVLILVLVVYGCKKEPEIQLEPIPPVNPVATIRFQTQVKPIFDSYCNGSYCHGSGADGKSFTTHANVIAVSSDTLLGAINHSTGFQPMPKSQPKLRQGEIDTITTWVNEGRLNN